MQLPDAYLKLKMLKRVNKKTFVQYLLRDDWQFMRQMLAPFHVIDKKEAKRQYRIEFVRAYNAEPALQRKANAGRRAANLFLFRYHAEKSRS